MAENPPEPYSFACCFVSHPHRAKAYRVQFAPDGHVIAMACGNIVETHGFGPGAEPPSYREFVGHGAQVTAISFSSNSQLLATSSRDSTIGLWNVSGVHLRTFTSDGYFPALCVKFHPESNMIASGSSEEFVRIWDVESGACLKGLPAQPGFVSTLDFSPNGSMIVAGSVSGLCRIWDTATGNAIITIKEPGEPAVGSVMFSSDGKLVLIGFMDSTLRIWSIVHGVMLPFILFGHKNTKLQILSTFSRDHMHIISGSEDNCLYVWEVMSGRLIQRIEHAHAQLVQCVSCHPTANVFASASLQDTNTVKYWKKND